MPSYQRYLLLPIPVVRQKRASGGEGGNLSIFPMLKLLVDQVLPENNHILPSLAHALFPRGPAEPDFFSPSNYCHKALSGQTLHMFILHRNIKSSFSEKDCTHPAS